MTRLSSIVSFCHVASEPLTRDICHATWSTKCARPLVTMSSTVSDPRNRSPRTLPSLSMIARHESVVTKCVDLQSPRFVPGVLVCGRRCDRVVLEVCDGAL